MDRITVDDEIVRDHVTVMEGSSDSLRHSEQSVEIAAETIELEPFSGTDPALAYSNRLAEALDTYHGSVAAMSDELLVMARKLTQLADQVTEVDDDLADRLRRIADSIDGGGTSLETPVATVRPGVERWLPVAPPTSITPIERVHHVTTTNTGMSS